MSLIALSLFTVSYMSDGVLFIYSPVDMITGYGAVLMGCEYYCFLLDNLSGAIFSTGILKM